MLAQKETELRQENQSHLSKISNPQFTHPISSASKAEHPAWQGEVFLKGGRTNPNKPIGTTAMETKDTQEERPLVGQSVNRLNGARKRQSEVPSGGDSPVSKSADKDQPNQHGEILVTIHVERFTADNVVIKAERVWLMSPPWVPKQMLTELDRGIETALGKSLPPSDNPRQDAPR